MFLTLNRSQLKAYQYHFLKLLIVAGILYSLNAQAICSQGSEVIEVHSGLYVRQGNFGRVFEDKNIANIGFIVGEQAIAVIDTGGSIHEGEDLLCQIRKVSSLPIRYVINTHVHPDHTMGNSAFNSPNTSFVGHENLTHAIAVLGKTYLTRYNESSGEHLSDESIVLPQILVADRLEIDLGNRPLTLIAKSRAHTNHDLLVYDKNTATLWLADLLFHQHIPVIGKSGSVNGWINLFEKLDTTDVKTVIPGHGSLNMELDKTIARQTHYLTLLRDEIRLNIKNDANLAQAMETVGLSESSNWKMFSTYHKRNISYIFSELEWE